MLGVSKYTHTKKKQKQNKIKNKTKTKKKKKKTHLVDGFISMLLFVQVVFVFTEQKEKGFDNIILFSIPYRFVIQTPITKLVLWQESNTGFLSEIIIFSLSRLWQFNISFLPLPSSIPTQSNTNPDVHSTNCITSHRTFLYRSADAVL